MKRYKNLMIAAAISTVFLILFNIGAFALECREIRDSVIRLHIVANSDTARDQELKIEVRDALLRESQGIFDGTVTMENAREKIEPLLPELKETAEATLRSKGCFYKVDIGLKTEYFDTRTYDNRVTLPAGRYLALKIVIGEGQGKNWWCVMFPSLCLPAAEGTNSEILDSVFGENEKEILLNSEKYQVKFKLVEVFQWLKSRVTG